MKKRILSMLLAIVMVVGMLPVPTIAAAELPDTLYVGGVAVVTDGAVGSVTSGTGWSYDTATATLHLTDGADIRYTDESDTYLKCGIYCEGVLNVHASGEVTVTGYGCGMHLPGGSLYLHAEEGATVNISSIGDKTGIYTTGSGNEVALSGKGTVNVSGINYGIYAGTVNIDGVTLNAQASTYADIDGSNIYVGQTEAAVVNCLGSTSGGIGGGGAVNIGIYNGSTVHVAAKAKNSSWLSGLTATNITITDSNVVIDGLTGTHSIFAIHGNTTVTGSSHILIRGITATESGGAHGVTTNTRTLDVSGDYYFREDLSAELIKNQTIKLLYVSQFELCTASHAGYCSNGNGTHYFGCFSTCPAAIKGENEDCSGETTCTEKAFCELCQTEHGPEPVGHIPDENGYTADGDGTHSFTCSVCGETVPEAHSTTADGDKPATCASSAYCSVCGSYYGEVDKTRHDSSVAFDSNGFCENGCYEPAVLNGGVYEISNAGQLYWFAAKVNGGETDIDGKLMANIVVNEGTMSAETTGARAWTPIGDSSNKYTGTFNGADFTISGLYFKDSTVNYVGLFGYVGNGATVQNITIADSYLSGQTYVGSVVGLNYGIVSNCINSSEIVGSKYNTGGVVGLNDGTVAGCTNSGAVSGNRYVGGVVGQNIGTVSGCSNSGDVTGSDSNTGGIVGVNHGTVTDCTNRGTVSGINNVGGIAGENDGTVSGCTNSGGVSGNAYVGGIVGDNGYGTVTNCHNTANVNATYSNCKVGGVAGYNYEGVVSNSYNTGTVNGNGYYVGGVVGYNCNAAEGSTVTNCYNTGAVTGADDVGGVVGHNLNGTVSNCYNTGTVTSAGDLGGVSGSQIGTYTNCYYLNTTASGGIFGADVEGQAEARTAEQFASGEVAYLLQGSQAEAVWGQNIDNGETVQTLPVFSGATVYAIQNCKSETLYSNTNENIGHQWENGVCTVCGDPCSHTGGTATCTTLAVCDICGASYGELGAHSTTAEGDKAATCASSAYCSVCESYYGEVDKTRHDSSVAFDSNGFCENGCYEPAVLNGGVYEISNAGQLYWFAAKVNGGETDIDGKLMANIVVNEGTMSAETTDARPWTPIGGFDRKYTGTFNGADYTISGLYFNDGTADYVGLFGYVGNGAAVQNITIADSYLSGQRHVGGVVGWNAGTVSNCINSSEILGSKYNTGGVVGLNDGTVTGCTNSGAVSGKDYFAGGIVGQNAGTVSGCINSGNVTGSDNYAGGIVGTNPGTVTDCTNRGTVSGDTFVGGIVGKSSGTVSGCTNSGGVSGNSYVGGIAGQSSDTVTNCHNTATVNATYTGSCYVGGVVGYNNEGVVSNCYNTGAVNGNGYYVGGVVGLNMDFEEGSTVTNCYNTGAVTSAARYVGGVVGENAGTITNCYYLDTCGAAGEGTAKTAAQFASGEVAYLLNGDQSTIVFKQTIGTDDTPNFTGDTVYYGYLSCADDAQMVYTNDENATAEKPTHTPDDAGYTDNGNGTHSYTCSVCSTDVTEAHSFGTGNSCVCGAEVAFTGIEITSSFATIDKGSGSYIAVIEPGKEGTDISYKYVGNNLECLTAENVLLKTRRANSANGQYTYLLKDMIAQGFTGTVRNWKDGTWWEWDYSNDGGITWEGVHIDVKQGYTITNSTADDAGGTIALPEYSVAGETVSVTVSPAAGYLLNALTVTNDAGGSVTVNNNSFTMPASNVTVSASFVACGHESAEYTDNGDGTHSFTCTVCGATVTEDHTMDVTTGKCGACGADMTAIATVTDGTNTYYAADAATLNQAVTAILETGSRTFTVELPADAEAEMITAIRRAICDTEGVADGSIHLTLKGVTSIPGTTNWDGVAFGPGDIYDEAGEIVDQELVTQLASVNLPDVTEIGAQAFYFCENLVTVSAPKAQTIGAQALGYTALTSVEFPELTTIPTDMFSGTWTLSSAKFPKVTTIEQGGLLVGAKFMPENNPTPFPLELTAEGDITFNGSNHFNIKSQNYSGKVDLVLCCDKKDAVTFHEDGTATWQVREDLSYTFKSITFKHSYVDGVCTVCGEACSHTGGTATCTTLAVCDICGASYGELRAHSTTADGDKPATCASSAYCSVCESYYGEVDKSNHDSSVAYDDNGFCPNGCYEPATDSDYDGVYEISNAGQLYWFAQQVNSGNTSINGKLMDNITVNEGTMSAETTDARAWTPIGNGSNMYTGTFNGAGFTVSGLYFNDETAGDVGLFGFVGNGATIQNVTLAASYLSGSNNVGGIVGLNYKGTVSGCTNSSEIVGSSYYVGGVVGYNSSATVSNCTNSGNVSSSGDFVGGVVGYNSSGSVTGCTNSGDVSGGCDAGGIVGWSYSGSVSGCANSGKVSGKYDVGGVLGANSGTGTVSNCFNTGTVNATSNYAGGVVGMNSGSGTVSNCYNIGSVSGHAGVGGVAGTNTSVVTNCYYLNGCATDGSSTVQFGIGSGSIGSATADVEGQTIGKSSDQFASGEVAYLLNGSTSQGELVWKQTIGTDDYPNFTGATVYAIQNCKSETLYSNTNENIGHQWENGVCTVCDETCSHTGGEASCAAQAVCDICGASYGEVDTAKHDSGVAFDSNGFCPNGCYEPAVLNGGVYEISNAGQLYWFAAKVNSGETDINGKLMKDIVVNEGTMSAETTDARAWTPIGGLALEYSGTFDGDGHTVSGLYFNDSGAVYVGLFSYLGNRGTVSNVGVIDSYFCGDEAVGGIVGISGGAVTNCYNAGTVTGGMDVGGVVGSNNGTVINCYNTGHISGSNYVGGVVGFNNYNGTVINCYNIGTVSGGERNTGGVTGYSCGTVSNCYNIGSVSGHACVGGVAGTNTSVVTNCYYLNGCATDGSSTVQFGIGSGSIGSTTADVEGQTIGKSSDQFASGEVAYLLNGSTSEGELVWKQTIGTDDYPNFTGDTVYYGYLSCADDAQMVYTNDENATAEKPAHTGIVTYTLTDDGTQHVATWSCCGTTVTEPHDFENDAHKCACGVVETFTVYWALGGSLELENGTSTFGQDFVHTFTVPENTHLRIEDVYLRSDPSTHISYTYENGVLTIAAADIPAGDIEVLCNHYVEVKFDANGGVIKPEDGFPEEGDTGFAEDGSYWIQEVHVGGDVFLHHYVDVTRTGYTLVDWRDANGMIYPMSKANGAIVVSATEDVTVYAQWQCNHTIGGVEFRDNGDGTHNGHCGECGELLGNYLERPHVYDETSHECACGAIETFKLYAEEQTLTVAYGADLAQALSGITSAKTGYNFTGWAYYWLNENGAEISYTDSTMPAMELYAKPVFEAILYNITWDMAGCSYSVNNYDGLPTKLAYNVDSDDHNINFVELTAPEGYEFVRFEDGDGNALRYIYLDHYRLYLTVSGDMTVRAVIQPRSYMATWTDGDGASYEKEFKYGETITIPTSVYFLETFRKTGYTLTGWEGYTEGMTMPIDGVTFTAIYQVNEYTITFDSDGGSAVAPITQDFGTAITAPEAPTRDGYHFLGWDALPETMPAKDITVKALWEEHKDYSYSASGDTITASCGVCSQVLGTATVYAEDGIYDGSAKETAAVSYSEGWVGGELTVSYENNVNAGTATASITIGGVTASVDFTIEKASPRYELPTGLTATYGDTLADVALPEGFTWQDDAATSVGNAGTNTFKVSYTPADTANYEVVTDIEATVAVAKADPIVTAPIPAEGLVFNGEMQLLVVSKGSTSGGTLVCYAEGRDDWAMGYSAGTYVIEYYVMGDDNYNDVPPASITVTIAPLDLASIEYDIKLSPDSFVYDASAKTPAVEVIVVLPGNDIPFETALSEEDFTVSYSGNIGPGTATVTIEGKGNYTGSITKTFEIVCDHSLNTNEVYTDNGDGTHSLVCSVCDEAALTHEHSFGTKASDRMAAPADCDDAALYYVRCDHCDAVSETETVSVGSALGHDYEAVVTEPTCTEGGYTTYTCSVCGDSYVADEVAALGHTEETVPGYAATCTEPGLSNGSKCSVCGETLVEQEEIPALGHDYEAVVTEPTCTEGGYTTYTCTVCGDTYVADEVAALGHDYEAVVTEPTCTEGGYTTYTCSVCGDSYVADEVAALGHTEETVPGYAATCTEPGLSDGSKCSVCGETLVEQEEIPALGHDYEAVVTAPTCTEGGYTTYTCSVCGDSYVADEVPAHGHVYDSICDLICNICGYEREIPSVPLFRMYDPNSGEHFYTGSERERDILISAGWNYEGVAFNFPVIGDPVYRLYNPVSGDHLYTMDEDERAQLLANGWNDEGVAFNSATSDCVPQYRLWNPNAVRGAWHFTGSEEERDHLLSLGWQYQGIGWYSMIK